MTRILVMIAALVLIALPAHGVEPDEVLDDPALEARARELSKEIRCVVCQNESIDTSNAEIARELRLLVRERLVAGDSDRQVLDFLVARYGDFVLLRPPFKPATYFLWLGPLLILALGAGGLILAVRLRRARPAAGPAPLSPEERARLEDLLAEEVPDKDAGP